MTNEHVGTCMYALIRRCSCSAGLKSQTPGGYIHDGDFSRADSFVPTCSHLYLRGYFQYYESNPHACNWERVRAKKPEPVQQLRPALDRLTLFFLRLFVT